MKLMVWNSDGLSDSKIKSIANLVDTNKFDGVFIQETRRDLENGEALKNLALYFPVEKWLYLYSPGSKARGTPGQGLLSLIRKIADSTYEIASNTFTNRKNNMTWHELKLKANGRTYKISHFYSNPVNQKLDNKFKTALKTSNVSFGDLNKTKSSYPVRHSDYQSTLEKLNLVELIERDTRIPKTVLGATEPTSNPDSVMTKFKNNESVNYISRSTLRSDHLAYVVHSDFDWPSWEPEEPKFGHYFKYSELTDKMILNSWNRCPPVPNRPDLSEVFSRMLLQIRHYGQTNGHHASLPPEYATMTTDEIFQEKLASSGKMCNLSAVFKLEEQIQNVREAIKCKNPPKISSKKRKTHYGEFEQQVGTASKVSHDQRLRHDRLLKSAKENRKHGPRITFFELSRELGKLKDSAPGVDGVIKRMLPRKASNLNKLLHFLNNSLFEDERFDPKMNRTRLQFVPKPGSEKRRPLGIGIRVAALMDRVMAVRMDVLVRQDSTYDDCFGFISELSTEEFFGRAFGVVEAKQNLGKYISKTQLDVKGAYTSVPHVLLILSMSEFINRTKDPKSNEYLLHFVAKWLENRTVEFEKTSVVMRCGLVQGSPVSPPIFVIFLSYSSSSKNSVILIYCDDVTLISWAATGADLAKEVKTEVNKFESWLSERQMEFAASKSKIMLFNRSLKTAEAVFKDVEIEKVIGMRVLGLWVRDMT